MRALWVFGGGFGLFVDGVGFPDLLPSGRIQGHQAAPEPATFEGRLDSEHFIVAPNRHIEFAIVENRRARDAGAGGVIEFGFPEEFAGGGVDRPGEGSRVAKESRVDRAGSGIDFADGDRGANSGACFDRPIDASGLGAEGIYDGPPTKIRLPTTAGAPFAEASMSPG